MPIYEYECEKCEKFEVFQDITDDKLEKCPTCESKIKRLIPSNVQSEVLYRDAKEYHHRVIQPEAKKIAEKIKNGDENAAADIFGEKKMYND